jgi:hypothetical protein
VFDERPNTLALWCDRQAVLGASDPAGRQAAISIGCGLANLIHAARGYGIEARIELSADPSPAILPHHAGVERYVFIGRVRFRPGAISGPEGVLHAMLERRSVRAMYNRDAKLSEPLTLSMCQLLRTDYPALAFHVLSDDDSLAFLGDLQELADSAALSREDFTAELGRWLLENDSDSPLGMRGRELGLSDEMTRGVQTRLLSEVPLAPEEVSGLARGGNAGMRSSSAVGIILSPHDDLAERVLAGRAFEDLVLMLHEQGFVTAMHAAITEVESANLALRARLGTNARPVVVFRMGQPLQATDSQRPHSARPSVFDVTIPAPVPAASRNRRRPNAAVRR